MPKADEKLEQAKQYLLRLFRYRPRTRFEAEARLRKRDYSSRTVTETLVWAERIGLIDDEAFARLWIADRLANRPRGIFLLRRELRQKGVSSELIERALEQAQVDEEALAHRLAAEQLGRLSEGSWKEREPKTLAFLSRRGFPLSLSRKVLRELKSSHSTSPSFD